MRVDFTFAQGWAARPIGGASKGPNDRNDFESIRKRARNGSAPFPIERRDPGVPSEIS
jgi:hypothetical protein